MARKLKHCNTEKGNILRKIGVKVLLVIGIFPIPPRQKHFGIFLFIEYLKEKHREQIESRKAYLTMKVLPPI